MATQTRETGVNAARQVEAERKRKVVEAEQEAKGEATFAIFDVG